MPDNNEKKYITDPALLEKLNSSSVGVLQSDKKYVTDSTILAELNNTEEATGAPQNSNIQQPTGPPSIPPPKSTKEEVSEPTRIIAYDLQGTIGSLPSSAQDALKSSGITLDRLNQAPPEDEFTACTWKATDFDEDVLRSLEGIGIRIIDGGMELFDPPKEKNYMAFIISNKRGKFTC